MQDDIIPKHFPDNVVFLVTSRTPVAIHSNTDVGWNMHCVEHLEDPVASQQQCSPPIFTPEEFSSDVGSGFKSTTHSVPERSFGEYEDDSHFLDSEASHSTLYISNTLFKRNIVKRVKKLADLDCDDLGLLLRSVNSVYMKKLILNEVLSYSSDEQVIHSLINLLRIQEPGSKSNCLKILTCVLDRLDGSLDDDDDDNDNDDVDVDVDVDGENSDGAEEVKNIANVQSGDGNSAFRHTYDDVDFSSNSNREHKQKSSVDDRLTGQFRTPKIDGAQFDYQPDDAEVVWQYLRGRHPVRLFLQFVAISEGNLTCVDLERLISGPPGMPRPFWFHLSVYECRHLIITDGLCFYFRHASIREAILQKYPEDPYEWPRMRIALLLGLIPHLNDLNYFRSVHS